jgi:4-amino-4-deoxy-L-arabinose transferase-like glycosyltransferase
MKEQIEFKISAYQMAWFLVIAGLLLRLVNLQVVGLWMDELHSTVGTDPDKTLTEVLEYCKADQPPLFFLLLHWWFRIFPYNDLSGRIFAVITGVLGIWSMYLLGKEYKNYKVGIIAAFLTTINYFHVDHSRQIRFYPMVFLFSALSYYFFIRIIKRAKPADFIFYILSTSALLNTHYFGMVVFASQFILFAYIILWKKIKDVRFILYSLGSGVAVGLSFLHWLPVVLSDLTIAEFHIQPLKWYFLVSYYGFYFRDYITGMVCAWLGFLAVRQLSFRAKTKSLQPEDVIVIGWIVLGFLLPVLYSVLRMPMLEYKYSMIVVPAILLIIAFGFDTIPQQKFKLPVVAVLVVSFAINTIFIRPIYYRAPFEEWREVTKEIIKTDRDTQLVFSSYAWYYRYYFKVNKSVNPPLEPAYANFDALLKNANQVWVVHSTRFPDSGLSQVQQDSLNANFNFEKQVDFVDAIATSYIRR